MEEAIQFFELLTTVAIFTVLVLVGIVLYFVVQIARAIRNVTRRIERGSEIVEDDFDSMRSSMQRAYRRIRERVFATVRRFTDQAGGENVTE